MRKKIQLHISQPCNENWDKMTPVEKGRFCSGCQKQVVDFTGMSNEQLVAFFRKQPANVCGRFLHDQLGRNIEIPRRRIPWVKYFFQFALPAIFVTSKGYSQGFVKKLERPSMLNSAIKQPSCKFSPETALLDRHKIIRGLVVNKSNESIPFATVLIKGTTSLTVADSSGHFELLYRGVEDKLVLVSSRINFKENELIIDLKNSEQPTTIVMQENIQTLDAVIVESTIMGALTSVVVGGVSMTSRVVEEINPPDTLPVELHPTPMIESVYPNPANSLSVINIKLGEYEEGEYLIQMISLGGHLLQNKVQWIRHETPLISIQLPAVTSGTYLVSVINRKSRKFSSKKIIVK